MVVVPLDSNGVRIERTTSVIGYDDNGQADMPKCTTTTCGFLAKASRGAVRVCNRQSSLKPASGWSAEGARGRWADSVLGHPVLAFRAGPLLIR